MDVNNSLDETFWSSRYVEMTTGWDVGYVSTPLKEYIDRLEDNSIRILIPGAGNAYEVEYLWNKGFKNVFLLDISPYPIKNFKFRNPNFPDEQLINQDFFDHNEQYDLILEQTFFCALNPALRNAYAHKMADILKKSGVLAGVLFNIPLNEDKPPFGGNMDEYRNYFHPFFKFKQFEPCINSIPQRMGSEIFIELVKK